MKKFFALLLIAVLLTASVAMLYIFDPAVQAESRSGPHYTLSSVELYSNYTMDEEAGDSMYINKIIEVSGSAVAIEMDSTTLRITLEGDGEGGVTCVFATLPRDMSPEVGNDYTIIGKCTGYIDDIKEVELNTCSFVE